MFRLPDILYDRVISVVCHDAGAANYIISWLKTSPELNVRACMAGPAALLWAKAFPTKPNHSLEEALEGSSVLLSGSGWASTLEHEARLIARSSMITIAVVDHWVNYKMRFERGETVLPDEIWVADEYAYEIAKREFNRLTVRQLPNIYLTNEVEAIKLAGMNIQNDGKNSVLYALEPIRIQWDNSDQRPGEFQTLDYFLSNLNKLGLPDTIPITLRPHPSDPPGKYAEWMAKKAAYNLRIDATTSLSRAMAEATWIAGAESFVLVIGLAAGRKVVSTLPPWGHRCRLPHRELIHLKELVNPE